MTERRVGQFATTQWSLIVAARAGDPLRRCEDALATRCKTYWYPLHAYVQRPTIVTITAGANDFLRGDVNIPAIPARVAHSINLLLNNDSDRVSAPVIDPVTGRACRALADVTILVSNYYRIPHPVPQVAAGLDAALYGFDQALRFWLQQLQVPVGSRVALVDLYSASAGQHGLLTIERRLGYEGPSDFDVHPTTLGHSSIAREFESIWHSLPPSGQ